MKGIFDMLKKLVVAAVFFLTTSQPAMSTTGTFFGATEITQMSNNLELVAMYAQDARNLVTNIRQYEAMLKNLKDISDFGNITSLIQSDMQALAAIVQKGEALAYSSGNLDQKFTEQNKGYAHYKTAIQNGVSLDFDQIYSDWSEKNMQSILGGLKAAELQNSGLQEEHNLMAQIQARLGSAEGALQATQAAGAVAAQQVAQLQKLRGLMMAQMQAQAAFQASQIERQTMKDAAATKFSSRTTVAPQYNNPAYQGTGVFGRAMSRNQQ